MNNNKKIAVVGAGIYGCSVALSLAADGHSVTLFDKNNEIMQGASWVNQYRLHQGYHYPRSIDTIKQIQQATGMFEKTYKQFLIKENKNLYGISKFDSKITADDYLKLLDNQKLSYKITSDSRLKNLSLLIEAKENHYDPTRLVAFYKKIINQSSVKLLLNTNFDISYRKEFDDVIICSYGNNNNIALNLGIEPKILNRYQIVEKIIVKNKDLSNLSVVVLDGNFCSFDPFGTTGNSVVGHVEAAVHDVVESYLNPWSNKIPSLKSKYKEIIEKTSTYIPSILNATYIDSMWTVRCVRGSSINPNDDRTTSVYKIDNNLFMVYSGKISASNIVIDEIKKHIQ